MVAAVAVGARVAEAKEPAIFSNTWKRSQAELAVKVAQQRVAAATAANSDGSRQRQVDSANFNLKRAIDGLKAQQLGQEAARLAARASGDLPNVLNGLTPTDASGDPILQPGEIAGLVPYRSDNPTNDQAQGLVWENALAPTEIVDGGETIVTVKQTAKKALLTWKSFNIGKDTTLSFEQKNAAGVDQNGWVAFNRVVEKPHRADGSREPGLSPSKILGKIEAPGEVYVVNQNGVIFYGTSQVNTKTFIASTLDIGRTSMSLLQRNAYYYDPPNDELSFSFRYLTQQEPAGTTTRTVGVIDPDSLAPTYSASSPRLILPAPGSSSEIFPVFLAADEVEGSIEVRAGAQITTAALGPDGVLGRIALIAPNIRNEGTLSSPDGQVILAATRNATLYSNNELARESSLRGARLRIGLDDGGDLVEGSIGSIDYPLPPGLPTPLNWPTPPSIINNQESPLAHAGELVNLGVILADRGNITLRGNKVSLLSDSGRGLNSTLRVTTSVNAPGSIFVEAQHAQYVDVASRPPSSGPWVASGIGTKTASLVVGSGSIIAALADEQRQVDGSAFTLPKGARESFKTSSIRIGVRDDRPSTALALRQFLLPSRFGSVSRPQVALGGYDANSIAVGSLRMESGSLLKAPAATVRLSGGRTAVSAATTELAPNIVLEDGAEIDVSGLMGVEADIAQNFVLVEVSRVGLNELADSPLQRDGFLYRKAVVIDSRLSGVRSDGKEWIGTPLFDASGYVNAVGLPVEQLMTSGGSVTIDARTSVVRAGAVVNLAGGYIDYKGGVVGVTQLQTADGKRVVDIGDADPNVRYSGFGGEFTVERERYGTTDAFSNPLVTNLGRRYETGYVEGADAGELIFAGGPGDRSFALFDGEIMAGVTRGAYQRKGGAFSSPPPKGGTIDFSNVFATNLTFQKQAAPNVPDDYATGAPISLVEAFQNQVWSTDALNETGAGTLKFGTTLTRLDGQNPFPSVLSLDTRVAFLPDADLRLEPGAALTIASRVIEIDGSITAPSGTLTFELGSSQVGFGDRTSFTLGQTGVLDVAGQWVNDSGATTETLVGRDFIDGGAVLITSTPIASRGAFPQLDSVEFRDGSVVNLQSGGHVEASGALARDGDGVPLGRGGDLGIVLHPESAPGLTVNESGRPTLTPVNADGREEIDDVIVIADGANILAKGFQGGGTFSLRAPEIVIAAGGGAGFTSDKGRVTLGADFFQQGFGAYELTALLTARVAGDAKVALTQPQLQARPEAVAAYTLADAVSGFAINEGAQRAPVDLTLAARALVNYAPGVTESATARNALIVETGAQILGEPGASIAFGASGTMSLDGTIRAAGGTITIAHAQGVAVAGDSQIPNEILNGAGVFLGADALLDVSGTFVRAIDPLSPFVTGRVVQGGVVSIDAFHFVGTPGSRILADGAAAIVDVPVDNAASAPIPRRERRAPREIASAGGAIAFSIDGVGLIDTQLSAKAGAPGGVGGSLSLSSGATVAFTQESLGRTADIPVGGAMPTDLPPNLLVFATDSLADSGIDALRAAAPTIGFSGDAVLAVDRQIVFSDVATISVVPEGFSLLDGAPASTGAAAQVISRYVAIRGAGDRWQGTTTPAWAPSRLSIDADTIDIAGAVTFANMGAAAPSEIGDPIEPLIFRSRGDIRFVPSVETAADSSTRSRLAALIRSDSDIRFDSAQLYPATAVQAIIQSTTADGRVVFGQVGETGAAAAPYSAGGDLFVSAAFIEQGGTVRAPLGRLTFGLTERPEDLERLPEAGFQKTQEVRFVAGSRTSVSADGLAVPFGHTENLRDWVYDAYASIDRSSLITAPPEKAIVIHAENTAALEDGATLDLSGGGDFFASEFVPGLGGSRDLRATSATIDPNGQVYALLPSFAGAVAPVDLEMGSPSSPTDPAFSDFGRTLTTLAGIRGLPAGTYLLLPGQYATLPGAFRVQLAPGTQDRPTGSAERLADGSFLVSGRLGYGGAAPATDLASGFLIQSGDVWRQYSDIRFTSANAEFAQRAARSGVAAPLLPIDAGRLSIDIEEAFSLGAKLDFGVGEGGRGGQVDLSAPRILVADAASPGFEDFVIVTPETIHGLSAASVALGATRTTESAGERFDVNATEIVVDGSVANSELILLATGSITVADGAEITGGAAGGETSAAALLVAPDVAALRVSDRGPAAIIRSGTGGGGTGAIAIGDARIDGGAALQLDSVARTALGAGAKLRGVSVSLASDRILLDDSDIGFDATFNLADNRDIVTKNLSLRASEGITFTGTTTLGAGDGSSRLASLTLDAPTIEATGGAGSVVSLNAATVVLDNTAAGAAPTAVGGESRLLVSADTLALAGGDRVLSGFGDDPADVGCAAAFCATAAKAILVGDGKAKGVLEVAGSVEFTSPAVIAAEGSDQRIVATNGAISIHSSGTAADPTAVDEIGGKIAFEAASISIRGVVAAKGGVIAARALSGDVEITSTDAILYAGGFAQTFQDKTIVLPGGRVSLEASNGDVTLGAGAAIVVAAGAGGDAGALAVVVSSSSGALTIDDNVSLRGSAGGSARLGGSFSLDTMGSLGAPGELTLDALAAKLGAGGFTGAVDVATGEGSLTLNQALAARSVRLSASDAVHGIVDVNTTIDASGAAGGRIELFGSKGVRLGAAARLLAKAEEAAERGGQVTIGAGPAGGLSFDESSEIDAEGGSDYGSAGGVVRLRTPFIGSPATGAIALTGAPKVNAETIVVEPYRRIDLTTTADASGDVVLTADRVLQELAPTEFLPNTMKITADLKATPGLAAANLLVTPGLEFVNTARDITFTGVLDLQAQRWAAVDGATPDQPGALTIRAAGDLRMLGTISDGFTDATPGGNLFASTDVRAKSWSYRLTAGARAASADPTAVAQAIAFESTASTPNPLAGHGNFVFGAVPRMAPSTALDPTAPFGGSWLIRTGTGSIDVAAGGAGLGERRITEESQFALNDLAREAGFHVDSDAAVLFLSPAAVLYTAGVDAPAPLGFIDDDYLASRDYGAPGAPRNGSTGVAPSRVGLRGNAPAFATGGGDIRITAPNGSIVAQQHYRDVRGPTGTILTLSATPEFTYAGQLFTPWLLGQGWSSNSQTTSGVFGGDGRQSARWVVTGGFQQGVAAMGGGDVTLTSGGGVRDISLSIVSTYRAIGGKTIDSPASLETYGGGRLLVDADGDVASIVVLVDEGQARITTRGSLTSNYSQLSTDALGGSEVTGTLPVASLFALGRTQVEINALGKIEIEGVGDGSSSGFAYDVPVVRDPAAIATGYPAVGSGAGHHQPVPLGYDVNSSFSAIAASGDVAMRATDWTFLSSYGDNRASSGGESFQPFSRINHLPPTVLLAAARGDLEIQDSMILAPATRGSLDLLAYRSLYAYSAVSPFTNRVDSGAVPTGVIKLIDADPADLLNPLNPINAPRIGANLPPLDPNTPLSPANFVSDVGYRLDSDGVSQIADAFRLHADIDGRPLHAGDDQPARLIALTGDIRIGDNPDEPGDATAPLYRFGAMPLYLPKKATVVAGRDIMNLSLVGQHTSIGDVTLIRSGRDIGYDLGFVTLDANQEAILQARGGGYTIGGGGNLVIQAGRDLALRPSDSGAPSIPNGVLSVGNRINPHLTPAGADINVAFGVAAGADVAGFSLRYIDPSSDAGYDDALVAYMEGYLTALARERDVNAPAVDLDVAAAWSAFQDLSDEQKLPFVQQVLFSEIEAIADQTRFPDQFQNFPRAYAAMQALYSPTLGYGDNLSVPVTRVATGNFDMVNAALRSDFGGDIRVLGPGGRALIGGLSTPQGLTPNAQGILTLRGGDIDVAIDGDFNVFSSRTLTLRGGDVTVFSGNGGIDAGRGRQTAQFFPPLVTIYNPFTTTATIDFSGLVTGSGIGTLQSAPGVEAGDVVLVAPRGDIDAGEAGIRASGNLFLLAVRVVNAENVQVGGQAVGIPVAATVSVGALSSAASATRAASSAGEQTAAGGGADRARQSLPSIITVEVLGYGEPDTGAGLDDERRR